MVRSRFGCVIDRFLRFVCRCWGVVRFLLGIVRSSLIGDLGHISVVMVSSVLHMLRPPIGKSNGVRTCRVCTQLGRFIICHDCDMIETKKMMQVASIKTTQYEYEPVTTFPSEVSPALKLALL